MLNSCQLQITAGLRVKLSDAGKEYLRIWDREKGTHYYDEGVGTVVASGIECTCLRARVPARAHTTRYVAQDT